MYDLIINTSIKIDDFLVHVQDLPYKSSIAYTSWCFSFCHKWPRICSVYRNHKPILSSFMTYHLVSNQSNTTSVTCETGTAYTSEALEFIPGF